MADEIDELIGKVMAGQKSDDAIAQWQQGANQARDQSLVARIQDDQQADPEIEALIHGAQDPLARALPRGNVLDKDAQTRRTQIESPEMPSQMINRMLSELVQVGAPTLGGMALGPIGATAGGAIGSGIAEMLDPSQTREAALLRLGLNTLAGPMAEGAARGGLALSKVAGRGVAKVASKVAPTVVPPVRKFAENQIGKAAGYMASSIKKLGAEDMRKTARIALDEGVFGPRKGNALQRAASWLDGSEKTLARANAVQDASGKKLQAMRDLADRADPGEPLAPMLKQISDDLSQENVTPGIIPGTSDAAALQQHLVDTINNVKAIARQGTKNAPVKSGPVGDRDFWEMSKDEIRESLKRAPSTMPEGPNLSLPTTRAKKLEELAMKQHRHEVAKAIVNGQNVPKKVLADYPELADLAPSKGNASTLARGKKYFGRKTYKDPQERAAYATRDEAARGRLQDAEDRTFARVEQNTGQKGLAAEFQRQKDVYGAMERLANEKGGVTESRVARDIGNNQVFGMTPQLAAIGGAVGGGELPAGITALLSRFLYQRGNQLAGLGADRLIADVIQKNARGGGLAHFLSSLDQGSVAPVLARILAQGGGHAGVGLARDELDQRHPGLGLAR